MVPWLAVSAWMPVRLPRFSCMGGSECVIRVACYRPCGCMPGLDPGGITPGGQRPIHWGCFWWRRFVANLLWKSRSSHLFVAPDYRFCCSVHADIAGPGLSLSERRAGLVNHVQSPTASNCHGTSPSDDTGSGDGTDSGH